MIQVITRERTNSVRSQKLILVEKIPEHPFQLGLIEGGEQTTPLIAHPTLLARRRMGDHLRMTFLKQLDQLHQLGMSRGVASLEECGRAQRQQPHHGPDFQTRGPPVRQPQYIIKEAILLVPHLVMMLADAVHGIGNPHEMLDEFIGNLFIDCVVIAQNESYLQHALAVESHPRGSVRLLQRSTGWKVSAAVEYADVVQSQEATCEDVAALEILAVDPPVEVQHQGLERSFEETGVGAAQRVLPSVQIQRGPGMHRWIDVAEVPLVGRYLAVRVEV